MIAELRTKEIIAEDRARFARAWNRRFNNWEKGKGTPEKAFNAWLKMIKKRYDAFALAKERPFLRVRLNVIVRSDDIAGQFLWKCFSRTLCYAADLLGEIADDVVSIDNDLKSSIDKAYKLIENIKFEDMYYRKDIGSKALKYLTNEE